MALDELGVGVTDVVVAELVDCVPAKEIAAPDVLVLVMPDETPTDVAQDATIEQTGAGPPPKGVC